jgi:membrane-bound metal-dependent hydrolase YbcI (DUF457 family)
MPTPFGHAIGGLAAALFANSAARRPGLSPQLLLAAAAAAVAPDLDILLGSHRTYTHSVGAAALVGLVSWLLLRRRVNAPAAAAAVTAAYGSHLLLDWLGKDTSRPPGLTVLWPFSSTYFLSGCELFGEVSRRYWLLDEFIFGNLKALGWEMLVLTPVMLIAWVVWSGRTIVQPPSRRRSRRRDTMTRHLV